MPGQRNAFFWCIRYYDKLSATGWCIRKLNQCRPCRAMSREKGEDGRGPLLTPFLLPQEVLIRPVTEYTLAAHNTCPFLCLIYLKLRDQVPKSGSSTTVGFEGLRPVSQSSNSRFTFPPVWPLGCWICSFVLLVAPLWSFPRLPFWCR